MYRYAQILNGKVHWIFEDSLTLDQLGKQKYNLSQITLVDITGITDVAEGYSYDGTNFINPETLVTDAEKLVTLKSSKLSSIKSLLSSTDYKCLKYVDGELSDTEYTEVKLERHNLRVAYNSIKSATTLEEVNSITYGI